MDDNKRTPLHMAAYEGKVDAVRALIEVAGGGGGVGGGARA